MDAVLRVSGGIAPTRIEATSESGWDEVTHVALGRDDHPVAVDDLRGAPAHVRRSF